MINLLLGAPGAGKSYEAVVFHVMPALRSGRKVITNLPLNIPEIKKQIPNAEELIEVRGDKAGEPAFSLVEHYKTDWRNEKNQGPFFVVDECHKALKRRSLGNAAATEKLGEWYAEHRHTGADVLLITQSYGKINRDIVDLIQMVWRCRKNIALGSKKTYVRKTLDGIRGAEIATNIRKYKPENFKFYQSHTASVGSVDESGANEVRPLWLHWSFISSAVFILIAVYMGFSGGFNPFPDQEKIVNETTQRLSVLPVNAHSQQNSVDDGFNSTPDNRVGLSGSFLDDGVGPVVAGAVDAKPNIHPFSSLKLHASGVMFDKGGNRYARFSVSQNGQYVFSVGESDLVDAGYEVEYLSSCIWLLKNGDWSAYVVCDSPSVGVVVAGDSYSGS